MELLRPGFLAAGALLALSALLLHLLAPRTAARRVLPTVRFLSSSPTRRIRLQSRPREPSLLLLRMALALALGAGLAGIHWHDRGGGGTGTLLLVDGGERGGPLWSPLVDAVIQRWSPGVRVAVVDGADGGGLPRTRVLDPAEEAELRAFLGEGELEGWTSLPLLLRALRREGAGWGEMDSVQAVVASGARAASWHPGLPRLRASRWPGAIESLVPEVREGGVRPAVQLAADPEVARALEEALEVQGWRIGEADARGGGDGQIRLQVAEVESVPDPAAFGASPGLWLPEAARPGIRGGMEGSSRFLLPDGRAFPAPPGVAPGTPAPGATVPLFREGGRPAAAAHLHREDGAGGGGLECRIFLPLSPRAGEAVEAGDGEGLAGWLADPALPDLMDGLLRWSCPTLLPAWGELEEELQALLAADPRVEPEDPGSPAAVRDLRRAEDGTSLTLPFLLLALLLLLAEWVVSARRGRRGGGSRERETR